MRALPIVTVERIRITIKIFFITYLLALSLLPPIFRFSASVTPVYQLIGIFTKVEKKRGIVN